MYKNAPCSYKFPGLDLFTTFFLGGSSLPGLSNDGWRERNSVISVGKAAASSLRVDVNEAIQKKLQCEISVKFPGFETYLLHVTMFSPVLGSTIETCGHSVIG